MLASCVAGPVTASTPIGLAPPIPRWGHFSMHAVSLLVICDWVTTVHRACPFRCGRWGPRWLRHPLGHYEVAPPL